MKQNTSPDPLANLVHLSTFIDGGGQITLGKLHPLPCVAVASDNHNSLAMLKRKPNETLYQLLERLDAAIAKAQNENRFIDEINTPR